MMAILWDFYRNQCFFIKLSIWAGWHMYHVLVYDLICLWWGAVDMGWAGKLEERSKANKKGLKEEVKAEAYFIYHHCLPLPPFLLPLSSLPFSSARAQGLRFDAPSLPAIVTPDMLHSSLCLLAFENKLRGPALFVVKNEWLKVGMFPRREVKGSVWTSGHLQCFTCRPVTWKGGWLPALWWQFVYMPLRSWDCLSGHLLWNPLWKTPRNWCLAWNP